MKKFFTVILMIFAVTAGNFTTASATDFLIGVKGGYFVWDPYLKRCGSVQFEQMENGSGELYGPVLSAMFTSDLSISVSGLFGSQSAHWISEDYIQPTETGSYYTGNFSMDVKRTDIDSALSYRLTENFKIFAGYKYQYNDMEFKSVKFKRNVSDDHLQAAIYENTTIKMPFNGPAAGIGFSSPIAEKFFFAANLSALYMWGKFKFDSSDYSYGPSGSLGSGGGNINGVTLRTRGLNFEPTAGASMGEGLPIFTVGIRFQWSQTKFIDAPSDSGLNDKYNNDYQYGLFVSVVQPI